MYARFAISHTQLWDWDMWMRLDVIRKGRSVEVKCCSLLSSINCVLYQLCTLSTVYSINCGLIFMCAYHLEYFLFRLIMCLLTTQNKSASVLFGWFDYTEPCLTTFLTQETRPAVDLDWGGSTPSVL